MVVITPSATKVKFKMKYMGDMFCGRNLCVAFPFEESVKQFRPTQCFRPFARFLKGIYPVSRNNDMNRIMKPDGGVNVIARRTIRSP